MRQCLSATGFENYPKSSNSTGNRTVPHSEIIIRQVFETLMRQSLKATGIENNPKISNSTENGTVPHSEKIDKVFFFTLVIF